MKYYTGVTQRNYTSSVLMSFKYTNHFNSNKATLLTEREDNVEVL